jgi:hypothetical protein
MSMPHTAHWMEQHVRADAAQHWTRDGETAGETTALRGLGSAGAGGRWRWVQPGVIHTIATPARPSWPAAEARTTATSASAVRIPEPILRLMRTAAWNTGRTESEIWAEAAREWLARRQRDDEPLPPTPAAAALPVPRRAHAWEAIDLLLEDLREAPQPERVIAA